MILFYAIALSTLLVKILNQQGFCFISRLLIVDQIQGLLRQRDSINADVVYPISAMPRKPIPGRKRINATIWESTEPALKEMAAELGCTRDDEGNIGRLLDAIAVLWVADSKEGKIFRQTLDTLL